MSNIKEKFVQIILDYQSILLQNVCIRLQNLVRTRYEVIDFEGHLDREEAFLSTLLWGLEEKDFKAFITFIDQIARKRSAEGYTLEEVQAALNIFAEELWTILVKTQNIDHDLIEMLGLCCQIFHKAKDQLARIYLQKTQETQGELDILREKFYSYRHDQKDQDLKDIY